MTWRALDPVQKRAVAADVQARNGVPPAPADQPETQPVMPTGTAPGADAAATISGLDEAMTDPETRSHL